MQSIEKNTRENRDIRDYYTNVNEASGGEWYTNTAFTESRVENDTQAPFLLSAINLGQL